MTSPSKLTVLDRADIVRAVIEMRDQCERILDVLLPDGEAPRCKHPLAMIEEIGDMGDDPTYRCTACNQEQATPFISEA